MPPFWLELTVVALAAMAAHELAHYTAAWLFGHDPWFTYLWDGWLPTPAVGHDLADATPWECRVTSLAPLALGLSSLAIYATGLYHVHPDGWELLVMWSVGAVPSPVDLENVYYADVVREYQAVWYGDHPIHAAAEGIAV
jgi:hypothetical protein